MKHVIIGAGAAGISAALTIRKHRPSDEVVVIISYERRSKSRQQNGDNFLTRNGIRDVCGKTITGINVRNRLVLFDDGMEYFDNLLVANNAIEPVFDKQTVNMVDARHLQDMDAVLARATDASNIVVVGASSFGLDIAYALLNKGKACTIVEASSSLFTKNLDESAAEMYKSKFENVGCLFEFERKVVSAEYDQDKIVSIKLDCGKQLECDMVIVAADCCPPIDFLAGSGIEYENGISIDRYCATAIKGIYAAGDVTGLLGICASNHGEVAAKNMCGIPVMYDEVPSTISYFDIPTLAIGELTPQDGDIVEERQNESRYEKIILRNGVVVGVLFRGSVSHSGFWKILIERELNVSQIDKSVFDLSFADFHSIELDM